MTFPYTAIKLFSNGSTHPQTERQESKEGSRVQSCKDESEEPNSKKPLEEALGEFYSRLSQWG